MDENMYAYWLLSLSGAYPTQSSKLYDYAGSFKNVWEMDQTELSNPALKLPEEVRDRIVSSKDPDNILKEYENLSAQGIAFYSTGHPLFPGRLKNIFDPPLGLFVRGALPDPGKKSVAIVGARACSAYGKECARAISSKLSDAGFMIISGMALGIDGTAQKAALERGNYSCGVLGCGVDICYPKENTGIYEMLVKTGGIVSEFAPGAQPQSINFPRRNRIISGLSDVVAVIEARERSGSLITADMALDQGKDVYAVPGRICDPLSGGCNRLIKQGAGIILSPDEFLRELIIDSGIISAESRGDTGFQMALTQCMNLSPEEEKVLSATGLDPVSLNHIQEETGLEAGILSGAVMKLTIKGLIKHEQGMYVRCG